MEVNNLQGELDDLAMAERKNQLSISEIRFRAAQQQRELNESELDQIRRLEMANEELSITSQKRTIQLMETSDAMKKAEERQSSLKKRSDELIKTVEMQTMGLTSLTDLLHQMRDGNITAAQALEIFGVRGGTAVLSLMSQVDAFDELVAANRTAAGTTEQFSTTLQQSSFEALRVFKSQVEEASITLGVHFVRALFDVDYQGQKTTGVLSDFGKTLNEPGGVVEQLTPKIIELANSLKEALPKAIDTMVGTIPLFVEVLDAVVKMLPALAKLGRFLTAIATPFVRVFELFVDLVNIVTAFDGSLSSLVDIFKALIHFVLELMVVINPVSLAFQILSVYFEDTNKTASKLFDTLADFTGVGKGISRIFGALTKRLPGLSRLFNNAGRGASNFLMRFRLIRKPVDFLRKSVDKLMESFSKLSGFLKNNRVSKFIGGIGKSLKDPRSSAEIVKSVEMTNRRNLAHAMGNTGTKGTAGLTPEQINAGLVARGVEVTPMPMFAKGGIVSKPTVGMIGEGGSSEAVVPLTNEKLKQIGVGIASASGGMGTNVTIGDIVINGDGLNKHEIQTMIERELPKIINRSMRRGAQGVI
jgi:hypothetical protein